MPKADARQVLIETAQQLYAEKGVAATTPRDVVQRSGVGQGSLYHHFPTKRDLAGAAVAQTVEETFESAARALRGDADPLARLVSYLERPRDATAGCRVVRLTADPLVMSDEGLAANVGDYFASLIDLVAGVFEEQGVEPPAARDRATAAVAVIQGGYVLSRALGDAQAMRAAVRGFVDLIGAVR